MSLAVNICLKSLAVKKTKIKHWLMDNRLVVGVGNIYASESLFESRILPTRPAGSLTKREADLLVAEIKRVLARSIEQGEQR